MTAPSAQLVPDVVMIQKTRIYNVKPYLARLKKGQAFRVAFRLPIEHQQALRRAGFPDAIGTGASVLPARVGPVSTFNSEGRWLIRKDLPKELRFVRSVLWSWEQWHGPYTVTKTEERDVHQMCYPREWIAAPGLLLTYAVGERSWIGCEPMINEASQHENIKHAINLMLEIFGSCELVDANFGVFAGVDVKRVHWQLLPPGSKPWDAYLKDIGDELKKTLGDSASIVIDRQDTIKKYQPDEIFVGTAGFHDYLAYVFKSRGVVILESVRHGNALYIFGLDWEEVSKLSKAQIITGGLAKKRIVHATGWKARIQLAMPPKLDVAT